MKSRIRLRVMAALAALTTSAALTGFAPASASASTVSSASVPSSTNYAGWLAGRYGPHATKLSSGTTFTVPAVTNCGATPNDFVVIGVGLPTGTTSVTASGVAVGCTSSGTPFYDAELDLSGTIKPLPVTVTPGDVIILSLIVTPTLTSGKFTDKTKKFSKAFESKGSSPTGSCVGIDGSENGTNGDPPIPDFGQVHFSASEINGQTITGSGATRVNMATSTGVLQIGTGAANKTGKGFSSTFKNSGG